MARIKVTGYIDTDNLDDDQVDLGHEMGLSSFGFDCQNSALSAYLEDVEFELEEED